MDDWRVALKLCLVKASLEEELYLRMSGQTYMWLAVFADDIGIMILHGTA